MDSHHTVIGEGARIVWRRLSVLWWVYAVNVLLGLAGTLPTSIGLASILNRSVASEKLVHGFDLPTAAELAMNPSQPFHAVSAGLCMLVFFVFMLFIEGGLLATYRADRKLSKAEFFEACGRFFWRFFRLLILFAIALVPILVVNRIVARWSDHLATDSPAPLRGFEMQVAGMFVVLFLLMAFRLIFDMAQVRVVVEDERAVRKALWAAFKLTIRRFPRLFGIYWVISIFAWLGLMATAWIWARWVRPESIGLTFLLTQAFLLYWLGTRFWQRAGEMTWYLRYAAPAAAAAPGGLS